MTITGFLADACEEMVTSVLPGFLAVLGINAATLGWIEGVSDAACSFAKPGGDWFADRTGDRKGILALGYFLNGTALAWFSVAISWPLILAARLCSRLGCGIRSPLSGAIQSHAEISDARALGFWQQRTTDGLGSIIGPLLGAGLLAVLPHANPAAPFRTVFALSLLPGVASVAAFAFLVQGTKGQGNRRGRLAVAVKTLPKSYTRFLQGVGLFGLGDYSHTLLILAATQLLIPVRGLLQAAQIAAFLYALRNLVYAVASYPLRLLADHIGRTKMLITGYLFGVLTAAIIAGSMASADPGMGRLVSVFTSAGIYAAIRNTLEVAITADHVPRQSRGTAYGVLGAVNGIGDLAASVLVGSLWAATSPAMAFDCAGAVMMAGTLLLIGNWKRSPEPA